jgi:hypothetical protein
MLSPDLKLQLSGDSINAMLTFPPHLQVLASVRTETHYSGHCFAI